MGRLKKIWSATVAFQIPRHGHALTADGQLGVLCSSELGTEHPSLGASGVDHECDILARCADSGVDIVCQVEVAGHRDVRAASLLQRVDVRHALGLHADDLRLSVDVIDEGKQHEASEEGEQHEAAERKQHLECHCGGVVVVFKMSG